MKLIKNFKSQFCVAEDSWLLECHVVSSVKILQTFQGIVIFPSKFPGSFLKTFCLKLPKKKYITRIRIFDTCRSWFCFVCYSIASSLYRTHWNFRRKLLRPKYFPCSFMWEI